ncbi:MAG: peroxiredoxin [Sphingomonadales bacterium]|nr:MAG: peroxiredoxin [Sphingomonadales bacterium]
MIRRLFTAALAMSMLASPALAALKPGTSAPTFTTQASLAGKPFSFSLSDTLKKGPVVLYFYPAAFTPGCTLEARTFADMIGDFTAAGATVVGISGDDIATLNKFSVKECQSKFAVAAASKQTIADYDAKLALLPGKASRVSYVIAPDGKIIYTHDSGTPVSHVEGALKAVRDWKAAQK